MNLTATLTPTTPTDATSSALELGLAAPADVAASELEEEEERGTSYARCADGHGTLSHLFFSDDDLDIARAKAICGACGLREACLAGAIERAEPFGVWGGKVMLDGVPVDVKRRRGRPPKHPRPVLVVDEVPIPPHLVA